MASIPLLCNICPKLRQFSDLSHLLTHVGSKGHLSCYFKLQVRSRQDPIAREQLDAYGQWFAKYEVERLLSERLTLKEAKKEKGARGYVKHIDSANEQKAGPLALSHRAGSYVVGEQLDPKNYAPYLKPENPGFTSTPLLTTDAASAPESQVPRMHLWPTTRQQTREGSKPLDTQSVPSIASENGTLPEKDSGYSTPSANNATSTYPDPSTLSQFQDSSFLDSKHNALTQDQVDEVLNFPKLAGLGDVDMDGEGTKLKGVFWPGMDIFDSATPAMKRKRNQKKDGSVLEQMMINSAEVEPTELIFTPEGKLKKQRLITGMVESSSPIKEESPKPKRRRSNPKKPALAEINNNYQRLIKLNKGAKPRHVVREIRVADIQQVSRDALAALNASSAMWAQNNNCPYMPTGEEGNEWKLTSGNLGPKNASGFTIFADTEQSGHTGGVNVPGSQYPAATDNQTSFYGYSSQNFGQLNDTSLLSSEFHLPSAHTPGKAVLSTISQEPNAVPAFSGPQEYGPGSTADKENSEPMTKWLEIPNQGSLPAANGNHQQYFATEGGPAPNLYQNLSHQTELPGFTGGEMYAPQYQQMTYNFQQPQGQDNSGYQTAGFQTNTLASPCDPMEITTGSDPCFVPHHNGADTFGLDADAHALFGGMTE